MMFPRPPTAPSAGFTLVEALVVTALVAVLAAIALPAYQNHREKVRVSQAATDIAAMSVVIHAFRDDIGRFPTGLAEVGRAGLLDPWGRPYRYLDLSQADAVGQARKNRSLVPINTDFDLYSVGRDGATSAPLTARASQDDVVRANDGRFVGLASTY